MEWHHLTSSAISAIRYRADTQELNIVFTSGPQTYTYYGVPEWKYRGLLSASSAGTYYSDHIRDQHSWS